VDLVAGPRAELVTTSPSAPWPREPVSTLTTLFDTLTRVDPRLVLVALVFHLANFGLRSASWRNVLRSAYPGRRVPLLGVAGAYAAGVAINSFTPARGGDVVKIALVRTRIPGSSVPGIASSMGVLALFDTVVGATAIGSLAAFGLLPGPPGVPRLPAGATLLADHPLAAVLSALALAAVAFVLARRSASRLGRIWSGLKDGAAILATPRRYATDVVPLQLAAWTCRIAAAYFLLAAFGVPATVPAAVIVVVVGGLSTLVPTPGGVGTQQVFLAYLLHTTASTATLLAFSLGMQATVTTLNALIGLTAMMVMLRTLRPASLIRARVSAVRAGR
jgi:uncharacterized membrane protein YbhN (UPF0104 family)